VFTGSFSLRTRRLRTILSIALKLSGLTPPLTKSRKKTIILSYVL